MLTHEHAVQLDIVEQYDASDGYSHAINFRAVRLSKFASSGCIVVHSPATIAKSRLPGSRSP